MKVRELSSRIRAPAAKETIMVTETQKGESGGSYQKKNIATLRNTENAPTSIFTGHQRCFCCLGI